jgi:hypothetical protein
VRPALESPTVRLLLGAYIRRLITNTGGDAVIAAEAKVAGGTVRIEATALVVSAGAVNSAALLLSSVSTQLSYVRHGGGRHRSVLQRSRPVLPQPRRQQPLRSGQQLVPS